MEAVACFVPLLRQSLLMDDIIYSFDIILADAITTNTDRAYTGTILTYTPLFMGFAQHVIINQTLSRLFERKLSHDQ